MKWISVRWNENDRWKVKTINKDRKKQSFSESVRAAWFCCAFKLSFVQSICEAS